MRTNYLNTTGFHFKKKNYLILNLMSQSKMNFIKYEVFN